jgi:hypothetical protein
MDDIAGVVRHSHKSQERYAYRSCVLTGVYSCATSRASCKSVGPTCGPSWKLTVVKRIDFLTKNLDFREEIDGQHECVGVSCGGGSLRIPGCYTSEHKRTRSHRMRYGTRNELDGQYLHTAADGYKLLKGFRNTYTRVKLHLTQKV